MLPAPWHRYIFLLGLIGLASGMMFGTVPTSIPQIILATNWLLEKDFTLKWQRLRSNKVFWILTSLFLLHVVGMTYTENTQRGLDDLRNKIPLLTLPLILFSTIPLTKKEFKLLFAFFYTAVIISSVCCFMVYLGFTKKVIVDIRQVSVFMSHIRFSLFISFAIIGLIYFSLTEKNKYLYMVTTITIPWLIFFMYKTEMATGFICLFTVGPVLLLIYLYRHVTTKISVAVTVLILSIVGFIANKAYHSLNMFDQDPNLASNTLKTHTVNGNGYFQNSQYQVAENGTLLFINISDFEIEKQWLKRSQLSYNGLDKKGNSLRYTVLRFLASKGLSKDSVGIQSLSDDEIAAIENGTTNYKYMNQSGLGSRWRELVWEYTTYQHGENPSGHTLSMRLEFWKIASYIIYEHPVFGVGTGDIQDAYNTMYEEVQTQLSKEWRLRCHNQYLAITVAFGFTGLLIFIIYLFYPAITLRKQLHYLYWPFFLIALLSFITEDTLETQSGVTFFIFFNALFLWLASSLQENTAARLN